MIATVRAALLALALVAAVFGTPARAQEAAPNANAILTRVKAELRTGALPAYVAYTLVRRDTLDNVPDFANSYTLRIWCRTADSFALARRVDGSRTDGPAEFIVPAFDKPIDPGPPTANLLDVIRQAQAASEPLPGTPPVIGSVSAVIERTYHVTFAGLVRGDYHLRLQALRDPDRDRLTDLFVDRESYALHRAVAHDHLFTDGRAIPERFEIDFGTKNDVPVIVAIHGETDYAAAAPGDRAEPFHTVDYRFEDVVFPPELPAWYFTPALYGAHRDEFPT